MNENTMTKFEYIKDHIVWGLLVFVVFFELMFTNIPGYTYQESLWICVGILFGILTFGVASTWRRERNFYSVMINLWISWCVFFLIFYGKPYRKMTMLVSVAALVITLGMICLIFFRRIKNRQKREVIIRRRIRKAVACVRKSIVCVTFVLMIPIYIDGFGKKEAQEVVLSVDRIYGDEHRLDANIDVIAGIHPDHWDNMDMGQRLEIGQKILNCEARYLGLTSEITLVTGDLGEKTRGHYSSADHQIVISETHLSKASGYDVLETILHECYHAYQYELIRIYQTVDSRSRGLKLFDSAAVYLDEFQNYTKGEDDFYEYYSQKVEADARKQSQIEMLEYIGRVEEYVEEKKAVENPTV